jgi:hypothetical protein
LGVLEQKQDIIVPEEESLYFAYGSMIHNEPYGLGVLERIEKLVLGWNKIVESIPDTSTIYNKPLVFIDMPGSRSNSSTMNEDIKANLMAKRILTISRSNDTPATMQVYNPPAGAINDQINAVELLNKLISVGTMQPLKIFYNSGSDTGSYNLTQIQLGQFENTMTGIMNRMVPQIEKMLSWILYVNGYNNDLSSFNFTWNYQSEMATQYARQLIQKLIETQQVNVNTFDIDKILSSAKLNIKNDDIEETNQEPKIETQTLSAVKEELSATSDNIQTKMQRYYKDTYSNLIKEDKWNVSKIKKEILSGINFAKKVWKEEYNEEITPNPKIVNDYRNLPALFLKQYNNALDIVNDTYNSYKLRVGEEEAKKRLTSETDNIRRKLADKITQIPTLYFTDLSRAKGQK